MISVNFNSLEGYHPAGVSTRCEGSYDTTFCFHEDCPIVQIVVDALFSKNVHLFKIPEQKSHHIEEVKSRFEEKSTGVLPVRNPWRILELSPVHLYLKRVRCHLSLLYLLFHEFVNVREPSIVSNLEGDTLFFNEFFEGFGFFVVDCHWFFTEHGKTELNSF